MRNKIVLIEDLNEESAKTVRRGDIFPKIRVSRTGNPGIDGRTTYCSVFLELGISFTIFSRNDVIRISEAYPLIVTGMKIGGVGVYTNYRCAIHYDLHAGDLVDVRVGREAESRRKPHTFNIFGYLGFMTRTRFNAEFYDSLQVGDPVRARVTYVKPREHKSSYVGVVPLEKLVVPAR